MKKFKKAILILLSIFLMIPTNYAFADTLTQSYAKEKIMAKDIVNKTLDLELKGVVKISDDCKIYELVNEKIVDKTLSDIIVGSENATVYFNKSGQVSQILIDGTAPVNNMRIGIRKDPNNPADDSLLDYQQLDIKSKDGFNIVDKKASKSFDIAADTVATIKAENSMSVLYVNGTIVYSTNNRIYALPKSDNSLLQIMTFKRGGNAFNPSYRGSLEITLNKAKDKLNLINEVQLEKYLYQVVPSEMPQTFGLEALKAQAVAARTYALADYYGNRFADRGFHVDDSTLSQVYNNQAENALSIQAIDETKGLIMKNNGQLVDARYYSTSGGYGASKNEVWSDADYSFPGVKVPYLVGKSYTYTLDPKDNATKIPVNIDTSNEQQLNMFYKNLSYSAYDSDSYYFRWKVSLSKQELENTINKNILLRYAADPKFILTKDQSGNFVSKDIPAEGVGTLKNMYVSKRGMGGNAMELVIEGSTGTYKILKEFNIRFTIRPNKTDTKAATDILAYRAKGGSTDYDTSYNVKNPSILYSAFFTFDMETDSNGVLNRVIFYGGGNGHGVGMSQFGASSLAANGYKYDQILNTYYSDINLVNVYDAADAPLNLSALDMITKIANNILSKASEGMKTGQYTTSVKANFKAAINKAVIVLGNKTSTNDDLNLAVNNLYDSMVIFNNSSIVKAEQDAMEAIAKLPDVDKITLDDEASIILARKLVAYANNDMNIQNLSKLVECEASILKLKNIPQNTTETTTTTAVSNTSEKNTTAKNLPKTGFMVDTTFLYGIGIMFMVAGVIVNRRSKKLSVSKAD